MGVDWDEYAIADFAGLGYPSDLTFGAGKLWAAFSPGDPAARALPTLLSSENGLDWAPVDLTSLDLKGMEFSSHDLVGKPIRLIGDEENIVVLFDPGVGMKFSEPQSAPTVLWGDGESWDITLPGDFPAWETNGAERDLPSFALASAGPMTLQGDRVVAVGNGWWWRSGAGTGSRGITIITLDRGGDAKLFGYLASAGPTGNAPVNAFAVMDDTGLSLVANSNPAYPGTPVLEVWEQADGDLWTVVHPHPSGPGALTLVHAASTTLGSVAIGQERGDDGWREVVFSLRAGSKEWERRDVPVEDQLHRILEIAGTVYLYTSFGRVVSSTDLQQWAIEKDEPDTRLGYDRRLPTAGNDQQRAPAVTIDGGAILLTDTGLLATGLTLPLHTMTR